MKFKDITKINKIGFPLMVLVTCFAYSRLMAGICGISEGLTLVGGTLGSFYYWIYRGEI